MSERTRQKWRNVVRRLGLPVTAALLVVALGLSTVESGETPSVADQVMTELRAAGAARSALLKAEQEWALERQKLALLKETLVRETGRQKSTAAAAGAEAAALKKEDPGARAKEQRLEQVEAMLDTLAERLEKALDVLGKRTLPGLVPPDRASGIIDVSARLSAAAKRLSQAEGQARKSGVELVTGTLDGKELTVKLLRAGAVAGWWCSLDCTRSGRAMMRDGKLLLTPASSREDTEAIQKAFAVAEGHAAPVWMLLPVQDVPVRRKAGGKP